MSNKIKVGVIVGRFQLPRLHEGYKNLINEVLKLSDKVLILVGQSPVKFSENYPLPFNIIKNNIIIEYLSVSENYFNDILPDIEILPIYDKPVEKDYDPWTSGLDNFLDSKYNSTEYDVTLYGSKKSFLEKYDGVYNSTILEHIFIEELSDSIIRNDIGKSDLYTDYEKSSNFNKGIIYCIKNQYPISYQCVDTAIIKEGTEILLGRKKFQTKWRFPGGFVDPTDDSLESAAKRECLEECGDIELDDFQYISSQRIDDWRYRNETNKIMTSFYKCKFIYGRPIPNDDLEEVKWFKISDVDKNNLVNEHNKLWDKLVKSIQN